MLGLVRPLRVGGHVGPFEEGVRSISKLEREKFQIFEKRC